MSEESKVQILECTLRDGSYAIDFKFTPADTNLLVKLLSGLGFRWIEVGHGLGLHAGESGKGRMPASDEEIIRAAKAAAGGARIGSFCIEGIAPLSSLEGARDAGLDFVRIGANATEVEKGFPYLEQARKLGLVPFLNFMKSYTISAEAFGREAQAAVRAGAEVVYCVDSAGGMVPEQIRSYISAARDRSVERVGLHAHNNLQMAVANAWEAARAGANFIDTTLYGLGRSAGNVPTEVAVALFEKRGIKTGIDLFELMDVAETYLEPLSLRIQMYDMLAVAMGYGQFHSSFLPRVDAAARKHGVDLRRLVVAAGERFASEIDDSGLEELARSLPKANPPRREGALISFPFREIAQGSISATFRDVGYLLEGMSITAAKRRTKPVLELTASRVPREDLVLAEMLLADDEIVLGRVTYGSFQVLEEVLRLARQQIFLFLVDTEGGLWARAFPTGLLAEAGSDRVIFLQSKRLQESYLAECLTLAAYRSGRSALLIYGNASPGILSQAAALFERAFVYGKTPVPADEDSASLFALKDLADPRLLRGSMDVILCLCPPEIWEEKRMGELLSGHGVVLCLGTYPRLEVSLGQEGRRWVRMDPRQAYSGHLKRWLAQTEEPPSGAGPGTIRQSATGWMIRA